MSLAKTLERLFADSLHWTNYPSEKPEFLEGMAQAVTECHGSARGFEFHALVDIGEAETAVDGFEVDFVGP